MAHQSVFPFCRLSPELRVLIYKEIFYFDNEISIYEDEPVLEENKFSILKVNQQIRKEGLDVLIKSQIWVVFRIHHASDQPARRGKHESLYHLPGLQFIAREPCLSALLQHYHLLVDVGKTAPLKDSKNTNGKQSVTTLVFPCSRKRFDYFCFDLWKNNRTYISIIVELFVKPSSAYAIGYNLLDSFTPARGYQRAVCNGFEASVGELLEERLTANLESIDDIYRFLHHYYASGYGALGAFDVKEAVHIHRISNLVLSHFAAISDMYSPDLTNHPGARKLVDTSNSIKVNTASAFSLCVDAERYLDDDKLPRASLSLIENALAATSAVITRRVRIDTMIRALYNHGLALRNKAEYESTYSSRCHQACRINCLNLQIDILEGAVSAFDLACQIAVDSPEEEEFLGLAQTNQFLAEDDIQSARDEINRLAQRAMLPQKGQFPNLELLDF